MKEVLLRPCATEDRGYILEHWVRAHSHTADAFHAGPNYMPGTWATAEAILDRSRCLVACAAADTAVILGFAVVEGNVVHYVFTRPDVRRSGIAKQLLGPLLGKKAMRFSHLPPHHACVKGRVVTVPSKAGPRQDPLPIPSSWVYDPFTRWFGEYKASKVA